MLFQGSALFDSMNIEENTAFYLKQHGDPATGKPFSPKEIEQKVKEALAMVGLRGNREKNALGSFGRDEKKGRACPAHRLPPLDPSLR